MDEAKTAFRRIYGQLGNRDKTDFVRWIEEEFMNNNHQFRDSRGPSTSAATTTTTTNGRTSNAEAVMRAAAEDIRIQVPIDAVLKSETIVAPTAVGAADDTDGDEEEEEVTSFFDASTSVHVDSFLYDDDAIDDLVEDGKFSRYYCTQCLSRDVSLLNFISHSASIAQVKYVVQALIPVSLQHVSLPSSSLRFLDVGSRFGPFLLGASLFSSSFSSIVGVELNSDLCDLQRRVMEKYISPGGVAPSVVCGDVTDRPDIVAESDVIVLHNVFQFFMPIEKQKSLWRFLFSTIRPRVSLVVACPSLEESLAPFGDEFEMASVVRKIDASPSDGFQFQRALKTRVKELGLCFEEDELEDFHVYQVL